MHLLNCTVKFLRFQQNRFQGEEPPGYARVMVILANLPGFKVFNDEIQYTDLSWKTTINVT